VHVHEPEGHAVNEQLDPCAQARSHPPPEQATVQVAPPGHEVLQWPLEQSTLQVPAPQYVRQCPLEQPDVQSPEAGHTSSQFPAEQSSVQGDAWQVLWQLPEEQLHAPLEQGVDCLGVPVPGSVTAGPPLGDPPPPDVLLEPPQAGSENEDKRKATTAHPGPLAFDTTSSLLGRSACGPKPCRLATSARGPSPNARDAPEIAVSFKQGGARRRQAASTSARIRAAIATASSSLA
jgi:hypothetical protein